MFGGHGLYLGDRFFGIINGGHAWFRTDAASRLITSPAGCQPSSRQPSRPKDRGPQLPRAGRRPADPGQLRVTIRATAFRE
jgi:hypothetical protein